MARAAFVALLATALACGAEGTDPPASADAGTQGLAVAPASLSLSEGGEGALSVALSLAPKQAVTVTLRSADPEAVAVEPSSLSFDASDHATPKTIRVLAIDDTDDMDERVILTASAPGVDPVAVEVRVSDDDTFGVVLSPTTLELNEGRSGMIAVRLSSAPAGVADVDVASADPAKVAVSPARLRFQPDAWDRPQTLSVSALDDADVANARVELRFSLGGRTLTAEVRVVDDDTASLVVEPQTLVLDEGGRAQTLRLSLSHAPSTPVVIEIVSSHFRALRVFPPTAQLSAASLSETVAVTPGDDDNTLDEQVFIRLRSAFFPERSIPVTIRDDDVQAILLSPASLSVREGATASFTARLAFDPQANLSVAFSGTKLAFAPGALPFTPADWSTPKTVTLTAQHDEDLADERVTLAARSSGVADATLAVDIDDEDEQRLVLAPSAVVVDEGRTATVSVSLAFEPAAAVELSATVTTTDAAAEPASLRIEPAEYRRLRPIHVRTASTAGAARTTLRIGGSGLSGTVQIDVREVD